VLLDVEGPTTCVRVLSACSPQRILHPPWNRKYGSPSRASRRSGRTATPAQRVRLVMALSETGGTLRYIAVSFAASVGVAGVGVAYSL